MRKDIPTRTLGRLAIWDEGRGPAVILWPSLFSDHRLYDRLVRALDGRARTIAIDGPGFGASDPPRGGHVAPEVCADAVVEVMDTLGVERARFVGTSWGGQVGAHVALRAPHRLEALVIANTPLTRSTRSHWLRVLGARVLIRTAMFREGVADAMLSARTRREQPEVKRAFMAAFDAFEGAAAAVTVRSVLARFEGLEELLPRITVPTTFVMGAEDALYPPSAQAPWIARVPGARSMIVPDCGHLTPLEVPEAIVEALESMATTGHAHTGP